MNKKQAGWPRFKKGVQPTAKDLDQLADYIASRGVEFCFDPGKRYEPHEDTDAPECGNYLYPAPGRRLLHEFSCSLAEADAPIMVGFQLTHSRKGDNETPFSIDVVRHDDGWELVIFGDQWKNVMEEWPALQQLARILRMENTRMVRAATAESGDHPSLFDRQARAAIDWLIALHLHYKKLEQELVAGPPEYRQ